MFQKADALFTDVENMVYFTKKSLYLQNCYTNKKGKKIFLIYKVIQMRSVAKSYMRKGLLVHEEMRKYLVIYEEVVSHIWLCNWSLLDFFIFEENYFLFYQCDFRQNFARVSCGPLPFQQLPHVQMTTSTLFHSSVIFYLIFLL